jgi:hypothetical protein
MTERNIEREHIRVIQMKEHRIKSIGEMGG